MEYEYLFTKTLHEKLKERIKGKVFCKVIDDTLVIDIETREGINYGLLISNFVERIQIGEMTHDGVIEKVIKEYKKKVLSTFFY